MALPPPDPQFVLRGTSAAVHTLHFSCGGQEPDVPILFSGSENGFIHVWNLKTHRVDAALDGHGRKSVYCVQTMGGKEALLSQGRDQRICMWDLAEGRTSVTDSVFTENVGFCRCSLLKVAQGRWLMAMAAKATDEVQVLELPSKTSVCTLKPEVGAKLGMPMCLKLWQLSCGSQPLLLAGYEDGSVVLWNLSTGKALSQLVCHQEPVMSLDFDSEKAKGISGSSEKVLSIWSLNEQQNLQEEKQVFGHPTVTHHLGDSVEVYDLLVPYHSNVGGKQLLQVNKQSKTKKSDDHRSSFIYDKKKNCNVYKTHKLVNAGISDITIRPDKKILATAGWDHRMRIFGWKKLKPLAVLDYHTATVHCVSFSDHKNPSERLLAAGSKDQRISIWSIYTQT
nr:guanine nucleotide-binding protein subunit beta-like protein 1 isoform X1 [Columba livia]XP_021140207.1 guanine nucleotide-binding protein subunit beta-like protein 1 isoform X1 [Columba livia]XP_021140214.1 guanine nucleotide-binding protein subunit beta-like protein 1 isoform X1 [Columba livia]XP_021140219.1 guanine nucleotide-binding protein subunit beta-like protein 1 isoform X1 [Columba livia]XP_021140220.1 guanine nucleotide-binding protein subunit beta-like protein 1 isoform X1 [Colum